MNLFEIEFVVPCCPELKPQTTGGFTPEGLVTTTLSMAVPVPALQEPVDVTPTPFAVESGFATMLTS